MSELATPSLANAPFASPTTPQEAALSTDGKVLHVTLGTGATAMLAADRLRAACRCAGCKRAQIDGVFPGRFEAVTITGFTPMGHYGINIAFSDGHSRGIFPWTYLADLAAI